MARIIYEVTLDTKWLPITSQYLPKATLDWFKNDLDLTPYGRIEWCKGDTSNERICNFRYMCYSKYSGNFISVPGNNSLSKQHVPQHYMARNGIVTIASLNIKKFPFGYGEVLLQPARNRIFSKSIKKGNTLCAAHLSLTTL